jgi:hypothetical protein
MTIPNIAPDINDDVRFKREAAQKINLLIEESKRLQDRIKSLEDNSLALIDIKIGNKSIDDV